MTILVLSVLAVAGFFVWAYSKGQSNKRAFFGKMRYLNQHYGTSFPEDEGGIDFILSNGSTKGSLVFDPSSKKFCFVTGSRQDAEVLDFSYIRQWQLHWTERSRDGRLSHVNVYFDFSTNDVKRPLIRIGVRNKTHGDQWNSRLSILLG